MLSETSIPTHSGLSFTATADGRFVASMVCPACKRQRSVVRPTADQAKQAYDFYAENPLCPGCARAEKEAEKEMAKRMERLQDELRAWIAQDNVEQLTHAEDNRRETA